LHWNIDQTLLIILHRLLNCEIGGLDCRVITPEYIERVSIEYTCITYFVMHLSMLFIWECLVNVLLQYV